jgi:hypothetical protein
MELDYCVICEVFPAKKNRAVCSNCERDISREGRNLMGRDWAGYEVRSDIPEDDFISPPQDQERDGQSWGSAFLRRLRRRRD